MINSIKKLSYRFLIYFCLLFFLFSSVAFSSTTPDPSDYTINVIPGNFIDISAAGTILSVDPQDGISGIPIEFDFQFYNNSYNTISIASDGYISFSPFVSIDQNTSIPSTGQPGKLIAPLQPCNRKNYLSCWRSLRNVYRKTN